MKTKLLFTVFTVFLAFIIVGCGGNDNLIAGSPSPSPTPTAAPTPSPTPSSTITSVSMSCITPTVPVGQANQCSATVQGTGNFNPAVSWSVNNIQGGNATVGTITATGLYTAPATVPTPFTVTIAATSLADSSKKDSVSTVVAGTIATTSGTITAGTGGTLTLPDGSSVTIAAGILPADQNVTLAEVSSLPNQTANPAISTVGPGLVLSFNTTTNFSRAAVPSATMVESLHALSNAAVVNTPAVQFSINTTANSVPLLKGSTIVTNFVDAAGNSTFVGTDGSVNSTQTLVSGNIGIDLLGGFTAGIKTVAVSAANFVGFVAKVGIHLFKAPNQVSLSFSNPNQPAWVTFSGCPSGKTLLVVHGMLSFVENAFPTDDLTIQLIKSEGAYDNVIGFDYDWTQAINDSGKQLASFLVTLGSCQGITELDIEGHSEGVPVSMSAVAQSLAIVGQPVAKVKRLVCVGGPIMGTPVADDARLLGALFMVSDFFFPDNLVLSGLSDLFNKPFIRDLQTSMPGNNDTLDQIRRTLASSPDSPQIIVIAGNLPILAFGGRALDRSWASGLMHTQNFDGIIPVASALAFQGTVPPFQPTFPVYPLAPVPIGHTELVGNLEVARQIGRQVTAAPTLGIPPSLSCGSTPANPNCEITQSSLVLFHGTGFSTDPDGIRVFRMDSSGNVGLLHPAIQDNAGILDWNVTPLCSSPIGSFSVFSFDAAHELASNNTLLTVDGGACNALPPPGTIFTIAGNNISGYSGDGGLAIDAELSLPTGVVFDGASNTFVADFHNSAIRVIESLSDFISTVSGTGVAGFSGDNGPANLAQLNTPGQVTFDPAGNIFVADTGNNRIRKIDLLTNTITTIAGTGAAGFSGDGGLAAKAELNFPDSITMDRFGNLYVADALNNRIRRIDAVTNVISTIAGNGTSGFGGDGGLATAAELSFPSRQALDSAGNLYISDFQNNRIRKVNAVTRVITTIAGTGVPSFSGDGGPAAIATLNGPLSVFIDPANNIFIADFNNQRIRAVNGGLTAITLAGITIQPGNIASIAGNGLGGFTGDGGPALGASLNGPTGVIVDAAGNLVFGDSNNNVVRKVTLH